MALSCKILRLTVDWFDTYKLIENDGEIGSAYKLFFI